MSTKVKSVRVDMGDCINTGDTLVINNSCRFSTTKLPTKVSDLANDCCFVTEGDLSCAVCVKADKSYVDCCLGTKQDCGDYALNCDLTSGLNTKQDTILDLSDIRSNASCGKCAYTTIGTYGNIVTHNVCEFQPAGDYALNCTMNACLACKYDNSNPCCYQTATEVACTVAPKADKSYVDCCLCDVDARISELQGRGKFLSNWIANTGKPETEPDVLPYVYHTGDYFVVTSKGTTNYKPTGTSYTGDASITVETAEVEVGDMYSFDGTSWLFQSNHGKTVSFANLSGVPSDNACLCSELAGKQSVISDLNTIRDNACCGKEAHNTISGYGDIVTHNTSEFQTAGDYVTTNTLNGCLACKQNNITDLDTIRINACCGACAKTIISGYGDIVSHNASEFQSAGSYAQCCDLTTGLSGKVDKVNGVNRVYGTDGSGCQTDYAYSDTVTANSIAKRDCCGNLCVADPTCNSHAATKLYVDDKVDNKTISWGEINGTISCQTDLQTALNCKQDNIGDLDTIRSGASAGASAVQPGDLCSVATSGKYCDLTGRPYDVSGGTAIAVSNGEVSVCYDNSTIKVNNSDQLYADYTGLQRTCNLVTNFSSPDDTHYPSAKAVADIVEGMSGGNMIKEIYDPCNCRSNIYDMDSMFDGTTNKTVTATEKELWSAKQEALTLPSSPTCGHLVVWGANKKTLVDGGEIPNSAQWGCITGTLCNQTDLQGALDCKAQCCDIPTNNNQLANGCGYTTCTGNLSNTTTCSGGLGVLGTTSVQGTSIGSTSLACSMSTALGFSARVSGTQSIGIGHGATGGTNAKKAIVIGEQANICCIGAIQLGAHGTNNENGSFCVSLGTGECVDCFTNYKLLGSDGIIPSARLDLSCYACCCDIPTNNNQLTNGCGYAKSCDLGTAASKNTGTSSGNVPVLDSTGKLSTTILPALAITDTFTVANKSGLTGLTNAQKGDIGIVTSESKTYVLSDDPYSTASNWKELATPTDAVTSVNGCTGAVTLDIPTNNNQLANGCGYTTCIGTVVASDLTPYAKSCTLCSVATSGKYCDLTGQPTIPTNNNQLTNGCGYTTCTGTLVASDLTPYAKSCTLCTVATSGKYCDLSGRVTDNCQIGNGCGYTTCTGTLSSCSDVISALGYTPYNSTNPNGYTTCTGTLTAETVCSGDTGCTYIIKVSNSAPSSATNNTITFVV